MKKQVKIMVHHLLIEIVGSVFLNDKELMEKFFTQIAEAYQKPVLGMRVHQFQPHGLSGLLVMPESHVAIHTWPEYQYAALDLFLQAPLDPEASLPWVIEYFKPQEIKVVELERGVGENNVPLVRSRLP